MSDLTKAHWEAVYRTKRADEVSWFRPHLDRSLQLIASCGLAADARIVDVGGGASTLADDLLAQGFTDITVLDLSSAALEQAVQRLGEDASRVHWRVGDATEPHFEPASIDLWHDRAVLHFLTDETARAAYLAQVHRVVRPGGHVLLATFAADGPEMCSALPVARYAPEELAALLGPAFEQRAAAHEDHATPWGTHQSFSYCLCQRSETSTRRKR